MTTSLPANAPIQTEAPQSTRSISYIDSVEIQQPRYYGKDFTRFMRQNCGSIWGPRWVNVAECRGFVKMWLHQPSRDAINRLREANCTVARVHVALDVIPTSKRAARDLQEVLGRTFLPSYDPYDPVRWKYSKNEHGEDSRSGGPTCYFGFSKPRGPGKTIAIYADKLSKAEKVPCCHLEVRVELRSALTACSLATPDELLQLDHTSFWQRRLFLAEAPTTSQLAKAWVKGLIAHRGPRNKRYPYGGKMKAMTRVGEILSRPARDKYGQTNANDLLYYLREHELLGIQSPMRLFRRLDNSWLLPPAHNAMWELPNSHKNQQVSAHM